MGDALYAGLRRGELQALRWEEVDLAKGIIRVERAWDEKGRSFVEPKSAAGKRAVPIATVLRDHLADDLVDVLRQSSPSRTRLKLDREEILKCSLDLRAEDSLTTNVHADEEVRVRDGLDDAVEATDGLISARQERLEKAPDMK